MVNDIIVVDDCISKNYQNLIERIIDEDPSFKWVYHEDLTKHFVSEKTVGFSHLFLHEAKYQSDYWGIFLPLVYEACEKQNININTVIRGRTFLQVPTIKTTEYDSPHIDMEMGHTVCLYYVNNTDGDTFFFNGKNIIKRVSPKKGRCVLFNGKIFHASSKPTKEKRIVINYNFI
jgi:hypothetical protein